MTCFVAVVSIAFLGAVAQGGFEGEIAALRPLDVSVQEAAILDNLEERARRALAAIRHAQNPQEADMARPNVPYGAAG